MRRHGLGGRAVVAEIYTFEWINTVGFRLVLSDVLLYSKIACSNTVSFAVQSRASED